MIISSFVHLIIRISVAGTCNLHCGADRLSAEEIADFGEVLSFASPQNSFIPMSQIGMLGSIRGEDHETTRHRLLTT